MKLSPEERSEILLAEAGSRSMFDQNRFRYPQEPERIQAIADAVEKILIHRVSAALTELVGDWDWYAGTLHNDKEATAFNTCADQLREMMTRLEPKRG